MWNALYTQVLTLISLLLIKVTSSNFQEMFIKANSFLLTKYLNFDFYTLNLPLFQILVHTFKLLAKVSFLPYIFFVIDFIYLFAFFRALQEHHRRNIWQVFPLHHTSRLDIFHLGFYLHLATPVDDLRSNYYLSDHRGRPPYLPTTYTN